MNPWHDVNPGNKIPEEVNVVVEVPKDCKLKYELDKETGLLKLDRALYSAVHYPGDYGFIPKTYWDDDDPLDVLILSNFPIFPMTLVQVRPIGVLEMEDDNEMDDKIICVHANDPRFNRYKELEDIPEHMLLEIKHFFETYKELQNKKVKVLNLKDSKAAKECIQKGLMLYKEKFSSPDQ
ncbi:inorganic diphosphatase [Candidatus Woesearchaeota archaeon]|nr:inorganic diphosphatase [Candidatus Woesearchaeota archaeon]